MHALGTSVSLVARIEQVKNFSRAPTAKVADALLQIRLNYARKTFAGAYAIGACFNLLALICSSIPAIFAKWLGKSEYMAPFGAWEVLLFIVDGTIVWQAKRLPKIAQ